MVIFTGTGDEFLTRMDTSTIGDINTQYWARIHQEGKDLLQNLLEIEVPIIGAVNGPAFIHAELPTLSDIVIASDRASFADKAHGPGGVVPGDGVHVWWPMLLGPNRARHFLLTGRHPFNGIDAIKAGKDVHWTAIGVIVGIGDKLIIKRDLHRRRDRVAVIRL